MDLNETIALMRDKIMEQIPNATEIEKGSGYLSPGQILEHMDKISPPARSCPANQDRYSILKPEEKCKDRFVSWHKDDQMAAKLQYSPTSMKHYREGLFQI